MRMDAARLTAALTLTALAAAGTAQAAPTTSRGAGELALDRGAVVALVRAALAEPIPLTVPRFGTVTLRVDPPDRVSFVAGGVEASLRITVEPLGVSTLVEVRYIPEVDGASGVVSLVATHAVPVAALPFAVDLAPLLPPAELPRSMDSQLATPSGTRVGVRFLVHGVRVEEERLLILFGLVMLPAPPQ